MKPSKRDILELFEELKEPVGMCDADGRILLLTGSARQLLGASPGAQVSLDLTGRDTFTELRMSEEGSKRDFFLADVEVRGAERESASVSVSPMSNGDYRVRFFDGGAESGDEPALAAEIDDFLPVLDRVHALVIVCDRRRRVVGINQAVGEAIGAGRQGVVGCDLLDLVEEERRVAVRTAAAAAMASSEPEPLELSLHVGRGGEPVRLVRVRLCPLGAHEARGPRGFVFIGHPEGVSPSELADRLAQAERLISLGQLATGVAHELKNPLTSIMNYADYLLQKYRGQFLEQRDGERLERIVDGVERIDRFVRDLLQMARPDDPSVSESVLLGEVIDSAAELCAVTIDRDEIVVTSRVDASEARVAGMRSQLEQVFVNLISNAAHAMPSKGGHIEVSVQTRDDQAICRVRDDGCGMSDTTRRRIFEPFFTTRSNEDGTGLGLALVRTIIDRHGGEIDVESETGVGTTFIVRLPLTQ